MPFVKRRKSEEVKTRDPKPAHDYPHSCGFSRPDAFCRRKAYLVAKGHGYLVFQHRILIPQLFTAAFDTLVWTPVWFEVYNKVEAQVCGCTAGFVEKISKYIYSPSENLIRKKLLLILVGEWCYMEHDQEDFSFPNGTSFILQTKILSNKKAI